MDTASLLSVFVEHSHWTTAFLGLTTLLVVALYYFSVSTFGHWKSLNVPFVKPVPLFGNLFHATCGIDHLADTYKDIYRKLAGHKYGGFYQMRTPYLMIRDPELVNSILVKDSAFFSARGVYTDFKVNPLSEHLFFMDGPRWKVIRSKLSPAFTSGKLKLMQGQIKDCCDVLIRSLDDTLRESAEHEFGVYSVLADYSTDVIGSCAFGLQMNSITGNGVNTAFRAYGKTLFQPSLRHLFRELCVNISPSLLSVVRVRDFPKDAIRFFHEAFHDTIAYRKENNVVRKDLVDSLIQARNDLVLNDSLPAAEKFNETQIVANAFVMFAAGFETVATSLSLCLYELSLKKHIQDRVRKEINRKKSEYNGEITYEFFNELPYMDMVIAETLRKYPPIAALFREATQTYKVPDDSLTIEKGQKIMIPFYSLHYDHKYFPDPEVFNPDRFLPEEKAKIPNGAYLPYGNGPRMCIGKRLANLELKMAATAILSNYEVEPCEKTKIPIKFGKGSFLMVSDEDIMLKFKKIS